MLFALCIGHPDVPRYWVEVASATSFDTIAGHDHSEAVAICSCVIFLPSMYRRLWAQFISLSVM